jgi:quercetin dioxygenase-like cupin family protein
VTARRARGPVWGVETEELNATLLEWGPGEGPAPHVNAERDVVFVIVGGSGTVTVDGEGREVGAGEVVVLEKGVTRSLRAGHEGIRYVSVHRRRGPLQIARR